MQFEIGKTYTQKSGAGFPSDFTVGTLGRLDGGYQHLLTSEGDAYVLRVSSYIEKPTCIRYYLVVRGRVLAGDGYSTFMYETEEDARRSFRFENGVVLTKVDHLNGTIEQLEVK